MIDITTNIKIAIAGCGSAGRKNIRAFLNLDEIEIVACCDEVEEIANYTAREFGISSFFTSINEMIEKVSFDALVIALPDGDHIQAAISALSNGINIFCENPLASNYEKAVEMTRAARDSGLVAMINDPVFNSPLVTSVINFLNEEKLGRIKFIEASIMQNRLQVGAFDDPLEEKRLLWRLSSCGSSSGAIGELGFPLFNIVSSICGEPKEVSAMVSNISGFDEIEEYVDLDLSSGDTFSCSLSFNKNCAGVIKGSWLSSGTKDHLSISVHAEDSVVVLDTSVSENEFFVYKNGKKESISIDSYNGNNFQEQFISAIKGEISCTSDFDHGLKIQHFIEQSKLSSEGGLKMQMGIEQHY